MKDNNTYIAGLNCRAGYATVCLHAIDSATLHVVQIKRYPTFEEPPQIYYKIFEETLFKFMNEQLSLLYIEAWSTSMQCVRLFTSRLIGNPNE